MESAEGARSFLASGDAYDSFMGRYSTLLARSFADFAGIVPGQRALDVGCGPGALTSELVSRLGPAAVSACDPSPPFVAACAARQPGVDVRQGRAEAIPFDGGTFDHALAQLVFHFVTDPDAAATEMRRVVRPGGRVSAAVWDFDGGMEMLRHFWDAAVSVVPDAPDEAQTLRFGRQGEIADLFDTAGLLEITETTLQVHSTYGSFDEFWTGFLAGIGPAGSYCVSLDDDQKQAVRSALFEGVGSPGGPFALAGTARAAAGSVPR